MRWVAACVVVAAGHLAAGCSGGDGNASPASPGGAGGGAGAGTAGAVQGGSGGGGGPGGGASGTQSGAGGQSGKSGAAGSAGGPAKVCTEVRTIVSHGYQLRHPAHRNPGILEYVYYYQPPGGTYWGTWAGGQKQTEAGTDFDAGFAAAFHPSATVAVLGLPPAPPGSSSNQTLRFFDRAIVGAVREASLPWPPFGTPGGAEPIYVSWDGEHYQVMAPVAGKGVEVALYDAAGNLTDAPVLVLEEAGSVLLESDIRTDPVSGDTWWTYPQGSVKSWVAGWDRQRNALTPNKKGVTIDGPLGSMGSVPGVGVGSDGALVVSGTLLYWSVAKLSRSGKVEWLRELPTHDVLVNGMPGSRSFYWFAPFQRADGGWSVLASDVYHVFRYDFDDKGNVGPETQLLTHSRCPLDKYCKNVGGTAYYLSAFQGEGETWLGFKDDSLAQPNDMIPLPNQWYRMVKIEPGCQVASMWDLTNGGTASPPDPPVP